MENTKTDFYGALERREFMEFDGHIPLILGEKEDGEIVIKDMAELPHMVIAGATGTGKSTLAHGIILSMVRRMPPSKLRLVLCDTKMLEFQCYKSLPHMLFPPQTDLNNIEYAITWVSMEMQKRLSDFADCGCRSLSAYNEIASEKGVEEIPYIVVIIDDASFAMEQKNIKQVIDSLARKGHAVGIHLVLVAQVAGAKQIADTIKSSIPARAVFNVFSNDEEKLLLGIQKNKMVSDVGEIIFYEIQERSREKITCFHITPNTCNQVVEAITEQYADFQDTFIHRKLKEAESQIGTDREDPDPASEYLGHDEMLPAAVDVILETGQASVSMIQRRLKLGYARAAAIIDEMEERGIVSPFMGSKPRAILITKEQWDRQSGADEYQEIVDLATTEELESSENNEDDILKENVEEDEYTQTSEPTQPKKSKFYEVIQLIGYSILFLFAMVIKALTFGVVALENDEEEDGKYENAKSIVSVLGLVLILVGIFSPQVNAQGKRSLIIIGIVIILIAVVAAIRWIFFSIFLVLLGMTGISLMGKAPEDEQTIYLVISVLFFAVAFYFASKFIIQALRNNAIRKNGVSLDRIDSMTGIEFEQFTAQLLKRLKYKNVSVTKASGDQGIDVLAEKDGIKYAIQCKNYSKRLDNTPIQEAFAGKTFYGCDVAIVITNNYFTDGAIELAKSIGVVLWDRDALKKMIFDAYVRK